MGIHVEVKCDKCTDGYRTFNQRISGLEKKSKCPWCNGNGKFEADFGAYANVESNAYEYPTLIVKVVELDPNQTITQMLEQILITNLRNIKSIVFTRTIDITRTPDIDEA